jgi:hypothetical protein
VTGVMTCRDEAPILDMMYPYYFIASRYIVPLSLAR